MISDVLSEAVTAIEDYQQKLPGHYDKARVEIDKAKTVMDALATVLVCPVSGHPVERRLRTALVNLDVTQLQMQLPVDGPIPCDVTTFCESIGDTAAEIGLHANLQPPDAPMPAEVLAYLRQAEAAMQAARAVLLPLEMASASEG